MEVIKHFNIHCGKDIYDEICHLDEVFYVPVKRYREDHVFDEDKSVRWNREEVEHQNQAQIDLQKKARELREESNNYFLTELYRYICHEATNYTFTEAEAEQIWRATIKHHDQEPWNWVDDMADSFRDFIIAREKER